MAKRMRDNCHIFEDEKYWRSGRGFVVRDLPWTSEKLHALPPFEFENWAVIALGGVPNTVQVGDMGIDGKIYPVGTKPSDQNDMFAGGLVPGAGQADGQGRPARRGPVRGGDGAREGRCARGPPTGLLRGVRLFIGCRGGVAAPSIKRRGGLSS